MLHLGRKFTERPRNLAVAASGENQEREGKDKLSLHVFLQHLSLLLWTCLTFLSNKEAYKTPWM